MKIMLSGVSTALAVLVSVSQAHATSTDVVLNLEGNPTCSSLVANDEIIEARDSDLDGMVTGSDVNSQMFTYTIDDNGPVDVVNWNTQGPLPVNFVVLKSKGNSGARVFHFGANGVFGDSGEQASGVLTAISFCYGIQGDDPPQPPEPPAPMARCEALMLDQTGIDCPASGEQRVLVSLSLEDEDDFDLQFCSCNVDASNPLPQCNPTLSRGEDADTEGEFANLPACTENDSGVNTRVPVQVLGVENPSSYICFTVGGSRVCYGHF